MLSRYSRFALFLFALCLVPACVEAQTAIPDSSTKRDTLLYIPDMEQHPAGDVNNPVNLEKHLIQNPTTALFKSMLVPGLGQMGNHRWFKAGLFVGLQGWFAVKAIDHGGDAHALRAAFEAETDTVARRSLHTRYESARSNRNKFLWFLGFTTFVSMFDAYVDAHLSGTPTNRRNDQFSVGIAPDPKGGASAVLCLRF